MLLAIDIGNSNIVIGCMNGMQIENEFRIATDFVKTSDQYCIDLKMSSPCATSTFRISRASSFPRSCRRFSTRSGRLL